MKKSLLVLALMGAFASVASAQSSVTLYGIVDAAVVVTTNLAGGTKTSIDAGQLATSRWGFKGSEDLGGGLKANFMLESTLANDTGAGGATFGTPATASLFDRASTVGLSGGFGSVNLGRQNMLGVDSIGLADPIGLAHAGTNPNVMFSALNSAGITGSFGANNGQTALRQNNSIKYLTPMVSGFGGAAMYGFGENSANSSANTYTGVSGYFTDGSSGAALAYAKLTDAANASTLTLVGGGAKYVMNPVTFKLTYAQSEVDTTKRKITVTGLGLDYAVSPATTLTGAYYNSKLSGLGTASTAALAGDGQSDLYVLMAKYALSKRTTAYASFSYANAASANGADTVMSLGLIGNAAGETHSNGNRTAVGVMHSF